MKILAALFVMLATAVAVAADNPYDETANAKLDITNALANAKTPIILVFGANWCPDCKELDLAMKQGSSAALLARDFKIVKIDVGHFDKNQDVADSYGVPLEKGIPAIAIINPQNKVLYVTKEGELANASSMSEDGIYQFFKRVTTSTKMQK
jgi:thioredoxin 1